MRWTDTWPTRLRGDLLRFKHKKTNLKVGLMFGTSGRALIGRHAMDRHSADTLAWRFVEIQAQKNQLKSWFNVWYQWADLNRHAIASSGF